MGQTISIAGTTIEFFKGADAFFAVDMAQLSGDQALAVRQMAADGALTQAGLTGIVGNTDFFSSVSMDQLWQFPGAVQPGVVGNDDEINPTLLGLLCLKLLQDTHQDIRQFFLENMFMAQDSVLDIADKERTASLNAAQASYNASIVTAATGLLGGAMQMGTSFGGGFNLRRVGGQLSETNESEIAIRRLREEIKLFSRPDQAEKAAAVAEKLTANALKATPGDAALKAERAQYRQVRLELRADRHQKKAAAEQELTQKQQFIEHTRISMDAGNNWAGLFTRGGQALGATANSAAGLPAAMQEKESKESSAEAQFYGTEGSTERANYDFFNGMSQSADGNFRQGSDTVTAIINAAASTNSATANRMA